MEDTSLPNLWKATLKGDAWLVVNKDGSTIATIRNTGDDEAIAKLFATSPYMLEALKAMVELIGDEDLPDNGELSGAAICDMVRTAVKLATRG